MTLLLDSLVFLVCKSWLQVSKVASLNSVFDLEARIDSVPDSSRWWTPEFERRIDAMFRSVVDWGDGSLTEIRVNHYSDRSLLFVVESNAREESIMDLDLNQEPLDPSTGSSVLGLGSLLNELETAHGRIEERIRQLEAVTARARQRQMWRLARNPAEASNVPRERIPLPSERIDNMISSEGLGQNVDYGVALQEGAVERVKSCKRDSTHLVAKALELDTDVKKVVGDGGGFFDCNICLDMAREPVLTCCGHLFCWACFYQLPYVYSTAKECPVCKGEVVYTNITPVYGNGNNTNVLGSETGLNVPPRPQAHRVESTRQQRVNRGISHIPVAEALRRIRMGIGATGERPTNMPSQVPTSELLPNTELGGGSQQRLRSRQFSRVLSENADSLLSISSALNNAERLVDDLEMYIHNRLLGRSHGGQVLSFGGVDSFTSSAAAVVQPEHQTLDSTSAEITFSATLASSSERIHFPSSQLENLRRDTAAVINLDEPTVISLDERRSSSSSRRRIRLPRVSDVDDSISREPRRRRLN
ncbi:RING-type E3 ubiquitin transferase [Sarracenia purpurea var. burkii]